MLTTVVVNNTWMNEWMNAYDLSDAVTETVAGALYRKTVYDNSHNLPSYP